MKWFLSTFYYVFVTSILIACTPSMQKQSSTGEMIKPGDRIGEMVVEQGIPALPYPNIWIFCEPILDFPEPASYTSECEVPGISGVVVEFGWIAKDTKINANWEDLVWDLSIDGHVVALSEFDWYEYDYPQHGENNKSRRWYINLLGLPPGLHTFTYGWHAEVEIDDGFRVYQPGTYEQVVYFRVLEKTNNPEFSTTTEQSNPEGFKIGLNPFASKGAGLDFLLYVPDGYGVDPTAKWPLLVYLHNAHLRGATLDLLKDEPLSRKLGKEDNFPFIVILPIGNGGFEFWNEDNLVNAFFALLEEVQSGLTIDPKRIYLMGDGMGGSGVLTIGLRRPSIFAALVPIGGYYGFPYTVPENICDLKDIPVWAFHGGKDTFVPVEASEMLVDAINACGGNAQITVESDMTTDILYNVCDDPAFYKWLLSQALE